MPDRIIDLPLDGPPSPVLPGFRHEAAFDGFRVADMPPGLIELNPNLTDTVPDVNVREVQCDLAFNFDKVRDILMPSGSIGVVRPGTSAKLRIENTVPGIARSVTPGFADRLAAENLRAPVCAWRRVDRKPDPAGAQLARLALG